MALAQSERTTNLVRQRFQWLRDAVFVSTANVDACQTYLETYQRVCVISDGPENPQDITQQKEPESPIPFEFPL